MLSGTAASSLELFVSVDRLTSTRTQAGKGVHASAQACASVNMDCCTFDRVLLFLEATATGRYAITTITITITEEKVLKIRPSLKRYETANEAGSHLGNHMSATVTS